MIIFWGGTSLSIGITGNFQIWSSYHLMKRSRLRVYHGTYLHILDHHVETESSKIYLGGGDSPRFCPPTQHCYVSTYCIVRAFYNPLPYTYYTQCFKQTTLLYKHVIYNLTDVLILVFQLFQLRLGFLRYRVSEFSWWGLFILKY